MNRNSVDKMRLNLHGCFKKVVFLSWIILGVSVSAQTNDAEIIKEVKELTDQMFVDMNNKDYEAVLEMTHPKVFEIASKEQMKGLLKSMLEGNDNFSIKIPELKPNYKLSKVYRESENNLDFVFSVYDMNMQMTFHQQKFDAEGKEIMISMMKMKEMDVTFISDNAVDVMMNDRITILLRDDTTENKWVMVNYDPDSPLFYNIVPAKVLTTCKEFKQNLMLAKKIESDKK